MSIPVIHLIPGECALNHLKANPNLAYTFKELTVILQIDSNINVKARLCNELMWLISTKKIAAGVNMEDENDSEIYFLVEKEV